MRRWPVALVALAIAGAVAFWFATSSNDAPAATHGDSREAAAAPGIPDAEPAPIASAQTPAREEVRAAPEPVAAPTADLALSAPAQDGLAELRGRFVLPNGAPASGVALSVRGWEGNQERVLKYGAPKDWPDEIKGASDADGRFSFRFDPPLAFQFVLDAKLSGYANVSWRWSELPPRQVTDVGEITLNVAGSIRGRVVDRKGNPAGAGWRVYADSSYSPPGKGGDTSRANAPADPSTGEFLLEGLPPGRTQLKAHSQIANWITGPSVDVRAGEQTAADVTYDGPDIARRITVVTFNRKFHIFSNPEEGTIHLLDSSGGSRAAKKVAGSSQSWSFDDVDAGSYTVSIDDLNFESWSQTGVGPGQRVDAHLVGSAALAVSVVDEESGAPVEPYKLRIRFRFRDRQMFPDTFELRAEDQPQPDQGLYTGIAPGDCSLIVEAPGYSACTCQVDALEAGEVRKVVAEMSQGSVVSGVVLDGEKAVADIAVKLSPHTIDATHGDFQSTQADAREVHSDASGNFTFTGVPDGNYELYAQVNPFWHAQLAPIACPGATQNLRLEFPPAGRLVGRLIAPSGATFEHLFLRPQVPNEDAQVSSDVFHMVFLDPNDGGSLGAIDATGAFRCGPLAAGDYQIWLSTGTFESRSSFNSSVISEGPRILLGSVAISAGQDTAHDFDVRARFPGWIELDVSLNGAPGAGLNVNASPKNAFVDDFESGLVSGQLDGAGKLRLGPLFADSWSLRFQPIDGAWTWSAPTPTKIAPGAVVAVRYDIQQH